MVGAYVHQISTHIIPKFDFGYKHNYFKAGKESIISIKITTTKITVGTA
jgi:hypothetical protein